MIDISENQNKLDEKEKYARCQQKYTGLAWFMPITTTLHISCVNVRFYKFVMETVKQKKKTKKKERKKEKRIKIVKFLKIETIIYKSWFYIME